jgi:GH35 family endo-1,4-beta-xylanase
MQKFFLAALMVLLPLSTQFAYAQTMLINDGFEVNYDGWIATGDFAQIKAYPGLGYNMSRGMKITNRQTAGDGAMSEKYFYLSSGEEYDYSVFVRHEQPTQETFNLALGSQVIASKAVPSGKWVELTAKFTAPKNVGKFALSITTNSTADFFFDDFKVTQKITQNGFPAAFKTLEEVGLKDIYAKYFRIGNILNDRTVNNTGIKTLMIKEYNSITMENEMKPNATMTQTGSTDANIVASINSGAAAILNFCAQNNIPVRGHVLTWHGQSPDWFFIRNMQDANWKNYRDGAISAIPWATPAVMNQRLESYIKNLFALYKDRYPGAYIYAYDVTNEACDGAGNMRPAGFDHNGAGGQTASSAGNSPWQGVYGANNMDWIKNAFTYARKYAPSHTKLFYNDFNEWDPAKRDGITNKILKPLFEAKLLDGMGMQSHVSANPNHSWSGQTRHLAAMEHYAAIAKGFEVQLTELDPSTENGQYTSQQPGRYSAIFQKALDINKGNAGKVTAICIWTPNDANTWLDKEDKKNTPALHDANNNRKPAYNAVAALVPEAQWGDGNNPTFGGGTTINPEITVTCNLNNLASSYSAGAAIPRPNVTCSAGTPGTASFSSNGSDVTGWASPSGTHAFYNPGARTVTLNSIACGSTTVTTNLTCSGSFEIVPALSSSSGAIPSSSSTTTSSSSSETTLSSSSATVSSSSSEVILSSSSDAEVAAIVGFQSLTNSPAPVEIYNLKGHKVDTKSPLPSGIYIAKTRGMRSKIFVVK